jgi:oligosaccharide reducing-end xylanase
MIKRITTLVAVLTALPAMLFAQQLSNGSGAFATGKYPDLFKQRGRTEREIKAKIDGAFRQLFFGDSATQKIYFPVGRNQNGALAYISDVPHNDIRTEGMSYGMMIAVQLNRKDVFDALWNYAMTYRIYEPK